MDDILPKLSNVKVFSKRNHANPSELPMVQDNVNSPVRVNLPALRRPGPRSQFEPDMDVL